MPAIRNHPLTAFLVVAFGFAWSMWLLEAFYPQGTAFIPSPTFGPLIAALIVLAFTRGKSGVKELLGRMVRWRVGLGWYAVAFPPANRARPRRGVCQCPAAWRRRALGSRAG